MANYAADARRLAGKSVLALGSAAISAGGILASGVTAGVRALAPTSDREAVLFCKLSSVTYRAGEGAQRSEQVLLLGYQSGFQVWLLTPGARPQELASRRDGPVRLLATVPEPRAGTVDVLREARPLLAVVSGAQGEQPPAQQAALPSASGASGRPQLPFDPQGQQQEGELRLYSLASHGFVRTLSFHHPILGVQASERLLVVALPGQLQAFDAGSLQHTFTCLTYTPPAALRPAFMQQGSSGTGAQPPAGVAGHEAAPVPFALGPRWLAFASDQAVLPEGSQAMAQRVPLASSSARRRQQAAASPAGPTGSGSSGGSSSALTGASSGGLTAAAVSEAALQAAQKGGQQLRAGLMAVGSASFKYLSSQYQQWRGQGQQGMAEGDEADLAAAGTVMVRDMVSRHAVAHFRAHTSPLAALEFSPGGDLLATASVHGHNVHVFRIMPAAGTAGPEGSGRTTASSCGGTAVHLYCLHRGISKAAVTVSFAPDARWVAVSSGRGTTHLYHTPRAATGAQVAELVSAKAADSAACAPTSGARGQEASALAQAVRLTAVGRARRPGLLGGGVAGGVAGAATSAALSLYGHSSEPSPVSAAFLPPGSACSPRSSGQGACASSTLCVVTSDGLLTQHLLRQPEPVPAGAAAVPTHAGQADSGASSAAAGAADSLPTAEAAGAAGEAPALEEAERWDVCRRQSWPEREEALPGLAGQEEGEGEEEEVQSHARLLGSAAAATVMAWEEGAPLQQQAWVAQAESVPCPAGVLPLWQDTQFRFQCLAPAGGELAGGSVAGAQLAALQLSSASPARPGSSMR